MSELPFFENYGTQTVQDLIALKHNYRVDSLVLAVEQALDAKPDAKLSHAERIVLAIESLEREVNNGGYEQFFLNSSRRFTPLTVGALQCIDCPKTAKITADAVAELGLPDQYDSDAVRNAVAGLTVAARDRLNECDSRYYRTGERIAEQLFRFIEQHADVIRIP